MAVGMWHRLDQTGRNLLPFAITVAMMLVSMAPMRLPGFSTVAPPLTLIAVFYWAIHRPDLLRPSIAFLIGLLQDLLSGAPLGMTPLVLTLCYWVLITQRRFFLGSSFLLLWWGFAMVAGAASLVQWAAYSLMEATVLDVKPAVFQALVAIAIFPAPAWILMRIHRAFLNEEG
ncbi:rod shape-determining protein MreD [Indioceanicola profundi]|uniref:rod shape-determining protein MreD n=1 Tax=Indioceanicola profundi TaxID=2220096 RepID=UPI000E6AE23C|nr:rod shape-determining protein MreD [Indioceanicola profundi]